jgi:enamine deaminase RidA (YjgF/YER057c/UK114 family)
VKIEDDTMTNAIEAKIAELGFTLPDAPAPAANYVSFVQTGNLVHVSGQLPIGANGIVKGKLGADVSIEDGVAAAQLCALSLLAQAKAATGGDLSRVTRLVKLVGFVNSVPDFEQQPVIINGASDLMVAVLGDAGHHARSAVSAGALPFNAAVEIEAIFEVA